MAPRRTRPSHLILALVSAAALLALVVPTPIASADEATEPEVIAVQTEPGTTIEQLTKTLGLELRSVLPGLVRTYLVAPRTPLGEDGLAALAGQLKSVKGVALAEVDQPVQLSGQRFHAWPDGMPGDDTGAADFEAQFATDGLSLNALHLRSTGTGTRVAVLDTGADLSHPVLQGRVVPRWNYVDGTADVSESAAVSTGAAFGHGTFVAGLIAKVVPGAQLYIYKVLDADGWGTSVGVAQAIRDAVGAKVDVISMSLSSREHADSKLVRDAISAARTAGIVVVAAAGNCDPSSTAAGSGSGEASCDPWDPQFPADVTSVLSVGALDPSGQSLAPFSGRGSWVKLAAPGVQIKGPLPDDRYGTWDGTSMSTALVAGQVAALAGSGNLTLLKGLPMTRYLLMTTAVTSTALALPQRPVVYGSVQMVKSLDCVARIRC